MKDKILVFSTNRQNDGAKISISNVGVQVLNVVLQKNPSNPKEALKTSYAYLRYVAFSNHAEGNEQVVGGLAKAADKM